MEITRNINECQRVAIARTRPRRNVDCPTPFRSTSFDGRFPAVVVAFTSLRMSLADTLTTRLTAFKRRVRVGLLRLLGDVRYRNVFRTEQGA